MEGNKKTVGNVLLISMRNMPIFSHYLFATPVLYFIRLRQNQVPAQP